MSNIRNFCIIAHIDHGKSTLADRLLELTGTIEKRKMQEQYLDMHPLERERGITIKLQPVRMNYEIEGEHYMLNLIDTPGHVDFTYEVSRSLAAVEGAILLIDATKGVQAQTVSNYRLAKDQGLVIIPVINKVDLPNARALEIETQIHELMGSDELEILKISAKTGEGVENVLKKIIDLVPPPRRINSDSEPLRGLIFDSEFNQFKGVIAYIRIFEGKVSKTNQIYFIAQAKSTPIQEVGFFTPQMKSVNELNAGEIGYVATGLKDISLVRVGDTLTSVLLGGKPASNKPLSGYKEPKPVVYASLFPQNADKDYDELKDALQKLKLEDASLQFQPESSTALGRGFRCGFLGMLHAEIIGERIRREFKIELIITTPSVEYFVKYKNEIESKISSASELHLAKNIDYIKEPMTMVEILTPDQYLGSVMKLMPEYRGEYQNTSYLSSSIALTAYKVPLAEIIVDFYDRLKSATSGYASMSYDILGFETSDLARIDVLVAGDIVESFSRIVHHDKAYAVGREIVQKLKDNLPKQLFTVAIQAALNGKIIARETLGAKRKDVTGYLYGGDVTRKKKLLEKQKRGKKLLKERSRVNIPQEVFLKVMKR